jgi:predicted TIM-barrel fold metal-dependent hydrolase
MIEGMDERHIESIILSPHAALSGDTREGNREMLEAVSRFPGRIYGYCTINPNFPADMKGELDACLGQEGVVGIKIHPGIHRYDVNGENYKPLWERVNAERRMILVHTWGLSGGCGASDMKKIAESYPDARILLGHSCYGAWKEAIALASNFPNVYLELTAASHAFGLLEWMCREAGSKKVLYGTDYPWFDPYAAIGCVIYAKISEEDMHNILWANAEGLLEEQKRLN